MREQRSRSILNARWVSVLFSTATILTTAAAALVLYGPRSAVLAALFLAFTPYHVSYSHVVNVDTTAVFWGTASMAFAAFAMKRRSIWTSIGAGFFSGLSAASKYPGILALAPLLVSVPYAQWVFTTSSEGRPFLSRSSIGNIAIRWLGAALAAVFGFALGCPLCVSDPANWWRALRLSQAAHATFFNLGNLPPDTALLEVPGMRDLAATIPLVAGWGIYLLALFAVVVALRRRDPRALIPLAVIIPLLVLYADVTTVFPRYFLATGPALAVLAAGVVPQGGESRTTRRIHYLLITTATAYSFALCASTVANFRVDDRRETLDWIEQRTAQRSESLRPHGRPPRKVTIGVANGWVKFEGLGNFGARAGLRLVPSELKEKSLGYPPPSYIVISDPVYQRSIRKNRLNGEFIRKIDRAEAGYHLVRVIESRFLTDSLYTWLMPQYQSAFTGGRVGFRVYERIDLDI